MQFVKNDLFTNEIPPLRIYSSFVQEMEKAILSSPTFLKSLKGKYVQSFRFKKGNGIGEVKINKVNINDARLKTTSN